MKLTKIILMVIVFTLALLFPQATLAGEKTCKSTPNFEFNKELQTKIDSYFKKFPLKIVELSGEKWVRAIVINTSLEMIDKGYAVSGPGIKSLVYTSDSSLMTVYDSDKYTMPKFIIGSEILILLENNTVMELSVLNKQAPCLSEDYKGSTKSTDIP